MEHFIVYRVVDGGYMENFGVLTAFEVAQAIYAVRPELKPFAPVIPNDPDEPVDQQELPDKVSATGYLTDITSLFAAINNTRDARGSLAVAQLNDLASLATSACKVSFAHIRVWPERINPQSDQRPAISPKSRGQFP